VHMILVRAVNVTVSNTVMQGGSSFVHLILVRVINVTVVNTVMQEVHSCT